MSSGPAAIAAGEPNTIMHTANKNVLSSVVDGKIAERCFDFMMNPPLVWLVVLRAHLREARVALSLVNFKEDVTYFARVSAVNNLTAAKFFDRFQALPVFRCFS
jgi:hypothetical protein